VEEIDTREEDHSEINKRKEYQERFCFSKEENGEELQYVKYYGSNGRSMLSTIYI
jgi:hypothetical protein